LGCLGFSELLGECRELEDQKPAIHILPQAEFYLQSVPASIDEQISIFVC